MLNNERGAVLPIIMAVATIFFIFTLFAIDQFVTEKKFYKEVEEKLVVDYLLCLASLDMEDYFKKTEEVNVGDGTFHYTNGEVSYRISLINQTSMMVTFIASTKNNRLSEVAVFYDIDRKEMIEWREK